MTTQYHVKITNQENTQTITIPQEFNILVTQEVIITQKDKQIIIEPKEKKSLLEFLSTLNDLDENLDDFDDSLLRLEDVEF